MLILTQIQYFSIYKISSIILHKSFSYIQFKYLNPRKGIGQKSLNKQHKMFKKRGQSNNNITESQNLRKEMKLIQIDQRVQVPQGNSNLASIQKLDQQKKEILQCSEIDDTLKQKMAQNDKLNDPDEQYLQKLKRDKKLQSLFEILQTDQNNDRKQMNQNKNTQTIKNSQQNNEQDFTNQDVRPNYNSFDIYSSSYIKKKIVLKLNSLQTSSIIKTKEKQSTQAIHPIKKSYKYSYNTQESVINQRKNQQSRNIQISQNSNKENKDMEDIFKEIFQQNKKLEAQQKNQTPQSQKEWIRENLQQNTESLNSKIIKKTNQLIVQDEDGFVQTLPTQQVNYKKTKNQNQLNFNVQVDIRGDNLSPQISQDDENDDTFKNNFYEEDYQDQLIRKTLTRSNYTKLLQKNDLKKTKQNQHKQNLLNKILKVSWIDIQNKLLSDIKQKVNKKSQLQKQVNYLDQRVKQREEQVNRKRLKLQQLQGQQQRLRKVIYFLCYFGDQLNKQGSTEQLFNETTESILQKIEKLSDRVQIEQFMCKHDDRQKLRQKYKKGRKRIKYNENVEDDGEVIMEQQLMQDQQQDDDEDDGEAYMEEDDY